MNLNLQLVEECKIKLGLISRKCILSYVDKEKQKGMLLFIHIVTISDDSRRVFVYDASGKDLVEEFKSQ
jgi:hypothetical protein